MDFFFVLLTQITNLTLYAIDFQVVHHPRRFLPKLRAGETRCAQTSRVRRRIATFDPGWKIRVLLDGEFTGLELDPTIMIHYVRVVFRVESNVLYVEGIPEIVGFKDLLLRHRYFGWMRNYSWNGRKPVSIDRSDSEKATKNRKGHCQHLAPFVDKQKSSSPQKKRLEANKRKPPTVVEEKTVWPTSAKKDDRSQPLVSWVEGVRPRDVIPEPPKLRNGVAIGQQGRVRDDKESPAVPRLRSSREKVRPRDVHKPQNPSGGTETRQQGRLRDDESMASPQVRTKGDVLRPLKPSNLQRGGMATGQQAKLRNDEPVNPQVRREGDVPRPLMPNNLHRGGMTTGQQARLRVDEPSTKPPSPQVRSREQVRPGDGGMATGQQARLRVDEPSTNPPSSQVRSREQVRPGDGGMATGQQARLRVDESSTNPPSPQVRSGEQVRTGDLGDQPQRPSNGGMATGHRARLRDDEASTNAGEMDSFVRGILLVFALTVCVLMKFVFFGLTITNVLKP